MQLLQQLRKHFQQQRSMLAQNHQEVSQSNRRIVFAILITGAVLFLPLLALAIFTEAYRNLLLSYSLVFGSILLLLFLYHRLQERVSSLLTFYLLCLCLLFYISYSSAFITPDYTCVIILMLLFLLPIIATDHSWRITLLEVAIALSYLAIVLPHKNPNLRLDELVNCLMFALAGLVVGDHLRSARLQNFELKRQISLRENLDFLTNLPNCKSLYEDYQAQEGAGEAVLPMGVLMLDIDHFKRFNDSYGHQAGDDCLRAVSAALLTFAETQAPLGELKFYRYGGEEFAALLPCCVPEGLPRLCEDLGVAIHDLRIPHLASPSGFLTTSIGFTYAATADQLYFRKLISQADVALYRAKSAGRNCARAFDATLDGPTIASSAEPRPSHPIQPK